MGRAKETRCLMFTRTLFHEIGFRGDKSDPIEEIERFTIEAQNCKSPRNFD